MHIDRLSSMISDGYLWCDAKMIKKEPTGTIIGMSHIKERRLNKALNSYPDLYVGECVPFYFCTRSIMLYIIHQANHPDLIYRGGQGPIIHLEASLHQTITWSSQSNKRWVFTPRNAGAAYSQDYNNLVDLDKISWTAVNAKKWQNSDVQEKKQAEFLIESQFPWHLIERIGVHSPTIYQQVMNVLSQVEHQPRVEVTPGWYY